MTWTLTSAAGETKTFAAWGFANLRRSLVSQAIDTVTFDAPGAAHDSVAALPIDSVVTIQRDGVQWFYGLVVQVPRSGAPAAESLTYKIAGPWWWLENLVFQQYWTLISDPTNPASPTTNVYKSHLLLNQTVLGAKQTTSAQITECVNYAITAGAPIAFSAANLPAVDAPVDEVQDITCAEAIIKVLRWTPDAVSWFDYATVPYPTLHIERRATLTAVNLDVSGAGDVQSIQITPRHDLQVPAVVLKFEQINQVNGVGYLSLTTDVYPPGSTGQEFGAFLATISLEGGSATYATAVIVTEAIAPLEWTWWQARLPHLADPLVVAASLDAATLTRGANPQPRRLVSGQIASWMRAAGGALPTAVEETLTIRANYTIRAASGVARDREIIEDDLLTTKILTTNLTSGTYQSLIELTPGEVQPVGLAQALYIAANVLQYDGQIGITEEECTAPAGIGKLLNLTGSQQTDWAAMNALIQAVTEDVDRGLTTIQFGPAKHLGLDDIIQLLQVNRFRQIRTPATARAQGRSTPGGNLTLGSDTPKESGGSGLAVLKRMELGDQAIIFDATATPLAGAQILLSIADAGNNIIRLRETEICEDGVKKTALVFRSEVL